MRMIIHTWLKSSLQVSFNDIEIRVQKDNHKCLYFTSLIRYFQQIQFLDKISQTFKVTNNLAKLFVYFQITNLKSCQNAKNAK